MTLPLPRLPFSAPGSYLGVSAETRVNPRLQHLRSLHRFADPRDLFALRLQGEEGSARLRPEKLQIAADPALAELVFAGPLQLDQVAGVTEIEQATPGGLAFQLLSHGLTFRLRLLAGRLTHRRGGRAGHPDRLELTLIPEGSAAAELELEESLAGEAPVPVAPSEVWADIEDRRRREFAAWAASLAGTLPPDAHPAALEEAAYILWSCQAEARGVLRRRPLLMSKNWMTAVWSWDNCFNALAIAPFAPELALDQLLCFLDHQRPGGRLPDFATPFGVHWGMTKPPVYGWVLSRLRRYPLFQRREVLASLYPALARQARFWIEERDTDGDGLPEYGHGCDSGWDNATCFEGTLPGASPDLGAWLILQLEELSEIAGRLGLPAESVQWRAAADNLLRALRRHCWDGTRWRVVRAGDHRPSPQGDSLLPWLVGLAGHVLDPAERAAVRAALAEPGRFLTDWGVATEALTSDLHEDDGYWRGPVWGPSTLAAVEAAAACGAPELARRVARRFVSLGPIHGFAENHQARSGRPLRDPAYSWTASAWVVLQRDWLSRPEDTD